MDKKQLEQIWNKTIDNCESLIDSQIFNDYLKKTYLADIDENIALILVDNLFSKKILQSNSVVITEQFQKIVNTNLNIRFVVQNEIEIKNHIKSTEFINKPFYENTGLKNEYTFSNFIKGDSNKGVVLASNSVSVNPGKSFNPLFIYGNTGLGKTHLLHAIGNEIIRIHDTKKKVLYMTSSDFGSEYSSAYNKQKIEGLEEFKKSFKNYDVLLIDDIQMLAKREKTNELFFDIFNDFVNANKQIVITSDKPPVKLNGFEQRLVSRFSTGLTQSVDKPDKQTAILILKNKLEIWNNASSGAQKQSFTDEALNYVAENYSDDVRNLQGTLNKLLFSSLAHDNDNPVLDLEFCLKFLDDRKNKKNVLTIDSITTIVAGEYKIDKKLLFTNSRTKNISVPRQVSMYLCRELVSASFKEIGDYFKGKDHSTVISSCNKIASLIKKDETTKKFVDKVKNKILNVD